MATAQLISRVFYRSIAFIINFTHLQTNMWMANVQLISDYFTEVLRPELI